MGPRAVGAPLRRRPRNARSAGDHSGHRRRPGAQGSWRRSVGVSSERRPRRLRRAAAHSRFDRDGLVVRRGARGRAADDGVHDAHAGAGRARRVPVQPGRDASGQLLGLARPVPRPLHGARRLRQRQRHPVQHDRAGAARRQRGQRRQPDARRGHPRHVGTDLAGRRRRPAASARDHQRRPRADLAVERAGPACSTSTCRPTGATVTTTRSCGRWSTRFPTRPCGPRATRCASTSSPSSASARASGGATTSPAPRGSSSAAPCSIPAR